MALGFGSAEQIGLNPAFTIHDREDSADLMNLFRHRKDSQRLKTGFRDHKGNAFDHRCVNAETVRPSTSSWEQFFLRSGAGRRVASCSFR